MTASQLLEGVHLLIAEDEFFLADDLARSLRAHGAVVLGPAPTLERAEHLLLKSPRIDAAILDVNLRDTLVYPVAALLRSHNTPFIFTTGYDEAVIPEAFRNVTRLYKPYDLLDVIEALSVLLQAHKP
jgi:DNA-binding response OmpR family regulator